MGNKASKGAAFERNICTILSEWWSMGVCGKEASDIFWRSSQSGGRATQRSKKGLSTFGSYGDIAAINPIGQPLMKVWTIELKRGSTIGTPWDLFDTSPTKAIRPFEAALVQAIRSHREAGSLSWLLIGRRDCRIPIVYADGVFMRTEFLQRPQPFLFGRWKVNGLDRILTIVAFPLDSFLKTYRPADIIKLAQCS